MLWAAISMFRNDEYIKGGICLLGALLFGIPIFIGWFSKSNSIKADKPSVPRLPLPATKEELIKLAKHITGENKEIMEVVLRCLENPKTFCQMEIKAVPEQLYDYQDLLFDWHEEKEDNDTNLQGIVMLFAIGNANFIASFDWKDDLETFLWKMRNLRCLQQHHLPIDDSSLPADGDIPQWCLLLNEQWKSIGFQIVFIDTDSDEYWVAIVPIDTD
ncbi:DUF6630 family protein [Prevotella falsenii]